MKNVEHADQKSLRYATILPLKYIRDLFFKIVKEFMDIRRIITSMLVDINLGTLHQNIIQNLTNK